MSREYVGDAASVPGLARSEHERLIQMGHAHLLRGKIFELLKTVDCSLRHADAQLGCSRANGRTTQT